MRINGRRRDGTLNINIGAGLCVLLRGDKQSPPIDREEAWKLGPWREIDLSNAERRVIEKKLARGSRVTPLVWFHMAMSFDEQRERVLAAIRSKLGFPPAGSYAYAGPVGYDQPYIPQNAMGDDWVVYCTSSKHYGCTYEITDDGSVTLGQAEEVRATWETMSGESLVALDSDKYMECKQSPWFKKFMANKKKLAVTVPDSVPADPAQKGAQPEVATLPAKDLTVELPGSLPDLNKSII